MPLPPEQLGKMISSPSIGAVAYQASALIHELKRINKEEYLDEACQIRDVFLCIAEYIQEQLWDLKATASGPPGSVPESVFARSRALGHILHEIYSYIRYLWASSPRQSPPGIQVALAQLTQAYFPKPNGAALCLVRPQWHYNLTYVPMAWYLRNLLGVGVLDPKGTLGSKDSEDILRKLWTAWRQKLDKADEKCLTPPTQLAILSFPGLDTEDTLLYPLLAHELGHFIDYSHDRPLYLRDDLKAKAEIKLDQVREVMEKTLGKQPEPQDVDANHKFLVGNVCIAIREILADLFATRMLGFAFFAAQSEFLKTVAAWSEAPITPTGYPGIKFRLGIIFDHLTKHLAGDLLSFLDSHSKSRPDTAGVLLSYLERWRERLLAPDPKRSAPLAGQAATEQQLRKLAQNAVRAVLPDLHSVVREIIPDEQTPKLTGQFFDRIARLARDLPPSCITEPSNCFAEVLAAGWAYQLIYGEEREPNAGKGTHDDQVGEYRKTCRLVLKSIELTPLTSAVQTDPTQAIREHATVSGDLLACGGVLGAPHIAARLLLPLENPKHLAVVPLRADAIQAASLDVHLGHRFVVARRSRLRGVRLGDPEDELLLATVGREEIFVPSGGFFLIHPGDLILGATLEFIALPADLMAFVEGRSSLGRKGLIVATATQVAPGFHGVIVLEMANAGTVPLEVHPEMAIAQLVLQAMNVPVPKDLMYHGQYHCQVHP
jgi:dCTP deaminase